MKYEITKEAAEYVCENTNYFEDKDRAKAICMMRLEGHSLDEIAEKYDLSRGSVRDMLLKVRYTYELAIKIGVVKPVILWEKDGGDYIPLCPYCKERAKKNGHCEACGKDYTWIECEEEG